MDFVDPYVFVPMLIGRKMDRTERTSPDLLFDGVLVDTMYCSSVILTVRVFGSCVKGFFDLLSSGRMPQVVPQGTFVSRQ